MKEHETGDHVVYGSSGVCCVEEIRTCRITPDMPLEDYYILKPLNNPSSTVFVPMGNKMLRSKMRSVMTREEIRSLLESVAESELDWIDDRKERINTFRGILAKGDRRELILLIRCILGRIQALEHGRKKVSASDQDILQSAERTVKEEFSFSLGIPPEEVLAYIRNRLSEKTAE